ncbi:EcsC family protein [Kitasatospora sp. NPDC002965]|uniref:EcsC family protein n=1 Tax=Kitasatospora sp. NPDC002965 TaxID=3154775 RepID=UPI0033B6CCA1
MTEPSDYEFEAWRDIQRFTGRPLSRRMGEAGEQLAVGAAKLGRRAAKRLESHPRALSAVTRGQEIVAGGARKAGTAARSAADAMPDWSGVVVQSTRQTVGRLSRAGLTPARVVKRHQKRGHDVSSLADLRRLDLEQIDAVRGRAASWYYPAAAALSGATAGLVISGGELVVAASAGAAAAPSGGMIVGALAGDAAIVLGLASRVVGHVSLFYGYDPESPAEKLFVMSVVNAGTAVSSSAKVAAMGDISRLTQALVRGKAWDVLSESVVTRVSVQFARAFGIRLTKKGLGKVVPGVGILVGSTLNWSMLERIVDTADMAYRRRFLIEKYPHLGDEEATGSFLDTDEDGVDSDDRPISVLAELSEAGGPNLP